MVSCPLCGASHFKDRRGLQGHLNFKHGYAKQTVLVKAIGENIRRWKEGIIPTWREEPIQKEGSIWTLKEEEKEINAKKKEQNLNLGGMDLEW